MTVGAALTVKTPVPAAVVPSPLMTDTFPSPTLADDEIVMLAVNEVEVRKVVEFTVIPVPEKEAAREVPVTKFVPLIVMFWLVAP